MHSMVMASANEPWWSDNNKNNNDVGGDGDGRPSIATSTHILSNSSQSSSDQIVRQRNTAGVRTKEQRQQSTYPDNTSPLPPPVHQLCLQDDLVPIPRREQQQRRRIRRIRRSRTTYFQRRVIGFLLDLQVRLGVVDLCSSSSSSSSRHRTRSLTINEKRRRRSLLLTIVAALSASTIVIFLVAISQRANSNGRGSHESSTNRRSRFVSIVLRNGRHLTETIQTARHGESSNRRSLLRRSQIYFQALSSSNFARSSSESERVSTPLMVHLAAGDDNLDTIGAPVDKNGESSLLLIVAEPTKMSQTSTQWKYAKVKDYGGINVDRVLLHQQQKEHKQRQQQQQQQGLFQWSSSRLQNRDDDEIAATIAIVEEDVDDVFLTKRKQHVTGSGDETEEANGGLANMDRSSDADDDDELEELIGRDDDYVKAIDVVIDEKEEDTALPDVDVTSYVDDNIIIVDKDNDNRKNHQNGVEAELQPSSPSFSKTRVVNTGCRDTAKYHELHPNCNDFHEMNLLDLGLTYIGHGDYRAAGVIEHKFQQNVEHIIFKHIHFDDMGYLEGYESTRMDALVADLLTASPRIYNVYGLCGYSAVSEYLPYGDLYLKTLDDDDEEEEEEAVALGSAGEKIPPEVWTDESILSPDEKLNYALQMAESIQDLHDIGIVHYDLKMDQFLFTSSNMTSIKLNDFNKAHMMMWNEEKKEYCNYDPHETRRWRSPEEYTGDNMNEKVDVFNYGNMLYVVLTGKWYDDDPRNTNGLYGGRLYLPDNHYQGAEAFLLDLVDRCRAIHPEDRPSMLQIIQELREQQMLLTAH